MAREGITETETFEWHPEVSEGVGQADILKEKFLGSKCKGPEAGAGLA